MSEYKWNSFGDTFIPNRYISSPISVLSAAYEVNRQRLKLKIYLPDKNNPTLLLRGPQAYDLLIALDKEPENLLRNDQDRELSDIFVVEDRLILLRPISNPSSIRGLALSNTSSTKGLSLRFGPSDPQILEIER